MRLTTSRYSVLTNGWWMAKMRLSPLLCTHTKLAGALVDIWLYYSHAQMQMFFFGHYLIRLYWFFVIRWLCIFRFCVFLFELFRKHISSILLNLLFNIFTIPLSHFSKHNAIQQFHKIQFKFSNIFGAFAINQGGEGNMSCWMVTYVWNSKMWTWRWCTYKRNIIQMVA